MSTMMQRPSRRGTRPSALEVSFGTLDDPDDSETASDASRKRARAGDTDADLRGPKRRNLDAVPPPVRKYERRPYEVQETGDPLLLDEEQDPPDDGKKRMRTLSDFTFFDARHDDCMISLDVLDESVGGDHRVLGAGFILAMYDIDEDGGQEDGLDADGDQLYVRLTRIHRYYTQYWIPGSPFYVETDHAIYQLDIEKPSKRYRSKFRPFWRLQKTLELVISTADSNPEQQFSTFLRRYIATKVFNQPLTERELWDAVPKLSKTLETVPCGDRLRASIVIQHLLHRLAPVIIKPVAKGKKKDEQPSDNDFRIQYKGNLDLAVLRQCNPTHVTPRIEELARGLFKEGLVVVGPKPRAEPEVASGRELTLRLQAFLTRTQTRRQIQFRPDQRIGRSRWLKHILIDGLEYNVGDTVLFYYGTDAPPNFVDLPPTDTLADHFWFGRIMHINEVDETVHVQWFEHSSKTFLQELGDPRELFLVNQCDALQITRIIGKVNAHYIKPDQSLADIKLHDYFYRYLWDHHDGTFTDIDIHALASSVKELPPDNCPVCEVGRKFDEGTEAVRIHLGVRWHGVEYHLDDCVLIKADEGPCHIGRIVKFIHGVGCDNVKIIVRLFGRTDKVWCRPDTVLKDERHLFLTDDEMTTPIYNLIGVCYVVVKEDMPELNAWLTMSSRRFYVKYHFSSLNVMSWASKRRMRWDDLPVCPMCLKQDLGKLNGMKTFLEEAPLRIFDPFAGTGAFGLAMAEAGCFKMTHGVEISPSAAKTLQKNGPADIKVYNQCSNLVLKHAILTHKNKNPEPLKSIEERGLPPPPKPGEIDCIITGFPCQPHSTLNMYQKANDTKSNLILTALSWVDFLKPSYCVFENVRGFLSFNLRARQRNEYSVKGGTPMGGLKLVAAALLDMGYQTRYALLQAAHYGTPQTRVRFFLIAAKRGLELPPFPQPTHDFPLPDNLEIKFPGELAMRPITTLPGVAPHRFVSVQDAISDLPRFDWKHPKEVLTRRQMQEKRVKECRDSQAWCGFHGSDVPYEHEPHTLFQKKCRSRPTEDIQHYTRTYDPKKVERVVEIPNDPNADYRSLRPDLWEWQLVNPASSVARKGFRAGYYGRVQGDGWFQTTVTNVDPTATQCRVIHPYSKRIVTVRELARSQGFPDHFVFCAEGNRVVTMHRQIGNAVPWPVSTAIAREFRETLYKDWAKRNPVDEIEEVEFTNEDTGSTDDSEGVPVD